MSVLYILGGLPGTGKSALSLQLAQQLRAVHVRIDVIEQALRNCGVTLGGPEGYAVAYRIAASNLRLGLDVVADSVNPLRVTRAAWRDVASQESAEFVEIEVICSDKAQHRRRIEQRVTDIDGLRLPTWADVVKREYEPWDGERVVVDTAHRTPEQGLEFLRRRIGRP